MKIFEAFTGVGSFRMALKNLGIPFEVVGISEVDKHALLAYTAIHHNFEYDGALPSEEQMYKELKDVTVGINFSTEEDELPKKGAELKKLYIAHVNSNNYGDIRKIDPNILPDMDLFTYSFPCKSISIAGLQDSLVEGSGTASSLVWDCKKIIEAKKPPYLIMENVKNLVGKKHNLLFDSWCFWLDSQGYHNYHEVLNATEFGIPQNRERVIMVSIRKDIKKYFEFPYPTELKLSLKDLLETEVDEKFYIPETQYKLKEPLPHQDIAYCIDANYWKGASVDQFIDKKRRQLVQVGELTTKGKESNNRIYSEDGVSPTLDSMQGGNRQPKILLVDVAGCAIRGRRNTEGKLEQTLEIQKSPVSNALTTATKDSLLWSGCRVRRLTPLECWRLMGYKDSDFIKARDIGGLSNTKLYERAGRGIVVPMLEKVFESLFLID